MDAIKFELEAKLKAEKFTWNKNCARFVGSQADATYFRPSGSIELLNPIYIIA